MLQILKLIQLMFLTIFFYFEQSELPLVLPINKAAVDIEIS